MAGRYVSGALLSQKLLLEARWAGADGYPSSPQYLTELEGLLGFIQGHDRLEPFWPRLSSQRPQERDDAVQEIRVARFLSSNGYGVAEWEPRGNANFIGEFAVQGRDTAPIFVEIKSPGWEGQLSQEQRDAGRMKHGKYVELEGGADDPWRAIRRSIKKAYPKFRQTQANLLVIADDRFMPLATWGKLGAEQALLTTNQSLDGEAGYFTTAEFENLGGIALFKQEIEMVLFPEVSEKPLRYEFQLYVNPMARAEAALPRQFVEKFLPPGTEGLEESNT
jgi:hypothetical protein